jgi:cytochrome c biogenesis protein CcmG/thiol:disulfide interchange protein DsbE
MKRENETENPMTEDAIATAARLPAGRSRLAGYVPLLVFVAMAMVLGIGLTLNPRDIPSPLIGKPVPEFRLPPVKGRTLGLSSTDLRGQVSLVNVFASWCVACREEHPVLMRLKEEGTVPIHGINYKDKPDDAQAWLTELGDPYTRTGADISGRVAIDWGVYGVPETYVIGRDGRIAHKHIGPISPEALRTTILPLIRELSK